ncbi:putative monovalent cation/H+ antiporter subunit A [Rubellicoccus peritrichatus]|uniref:Monovalent cation/H+ antiporter subunit A n=1 Tax=Rubellicoccus peritrichatus TaxID=3080537 RepID=A0AAQ3L9M8_9BACT|nr:putative monovalent cation/H+ antiporter subunit A [Puniceicoccus sp. CR14]WOO39880.1 putative monovalent cation/H+ antiporter subunit A [Puniceicoccus sp. CR14]
MLLIASLIIIFIAAFVAPLVCRYLKRGEGYVLAVAPLLAFVAIASQIPFVGSGVNVHFSFEWFSALGVALDFKLDGLAMLMALLVTGVGTLIVIYAGGYMHGHPQLGRFFLYLLSFMGAMLGLVLSDNLLLLFVFWELTSITSYLLIGFNHEQKESRWKALQALLITGFGAVAMLAGFILIGIVAGTYNLTEINLMSMDIESVREIFHSSPLYTAIVVLVLLGAFTKSAQVPFHFWLPNAMAAPTPVSAYLHSATMVKAGVFLLARLNPALGGSMSWSWTLTIFGSITLLLAVALGLFQTDLKRILAYTTLAVLGMLTMLIGVGTEMAIQSMVIFLLGHALYKAALFMTAGSIDHETGTRDVTVLRGLRGVMPITATAACLAALSKSGFPPFFGFVGKEYVYKAGVGMEGVAQYVLGAAFIGNLIILALAFKAGVAPFFGKLKAELPKKPHEAPMSMWLGPIILGVLGLVLGLFPILVSSSLIAPAVSAIEGQPVELSVKLWHGINLPLLISMATLAGGLVVFSFRKAVWSRADEILTAIRPYGAEAAYERLFNGVVWFSKAQTRWLQSGYLHHYVFTVVITAAGFLLWALTKFGGLSFDIDWVNFDILTAGLVLVMIISTCVAATTESRITALVALGVIGFGVALIFVYFGAPDLAITQLLVETLVVVLFMFVIVRLPTFKSYSTKATKIRDGILACGFGLLMTVMVLKAVNIQFDHPIAEKLAEMSYPEAKGKNVVNVILVDFRAIDTFGEIVVVTTAALGIAALVSTRFKKGKEATK